MHYRAVVAHSGVVLEGELHGFMHLEAPDSEKIVTLT
jgi:hypothetical protein